jgi:predicted DNA-binding WGR domain protein
MTQHRFRLYVQRIDTTKNMARFYAMSIEPDLFGGSALVRRWGRIGTRGQERIDLFTEPLSWPLKACLPDIEFVRTLCGGSPCSVERWADARRVRLAQR